MLRRQGLDLLNRVRDLSMSTPILMMSGDYDRRKEADALIEGATGYLHRTACVDRDAAGRVGGAEADRRHKLI